MTLLSSDDEAGPCDFTSLPSFSYCCNTVHPPYNDPQATDTVTIRASFNVFLAFMSAFVQLQSHSNKLKDA